MFYGHNRAIVRLVQQQFGQIDGIQVDPSALEVDDGPLAPVDEVWSPSAGDPDIEAKLPE